MYLLVYSFAHLLAASQPLTELGERTGPRLRELPPRGSQEAGLAQPQAHSFALLSLSVLPNHSHSFPHPFAFGGPFQYAAPS